MVLAFVCCVGGSNGQANGQQLRQVQRFEREPEDQTAVVGETVVMACRVLNKGGVLQWTKDDFGLGSDRNLSGFERYSMIGTEDEGELHLFNFITLAYFSLMPLFMFSSFSLQEGGLTWSLNAMASSSISRYAIRWLPLLSKVVFFHLFILSLVSSFCPVLIGSFITRRGEIEGASGKRPTHSIRNARVSFTSSRRPSLLSSFSLWLDI